MFKIAVNAAPQLIAQFADLDVARDFIGSFAPRKSANDNSAAKLSQVSLSLQRVGAECAD